MTSVEHEFHTAFEDNLYDHFNKVEDLVKQLRNDHMAF
jgi:acyl carrier protein